MTIFRIEIRNASAALSKPNQLRNENTIRWESRNITTQPGEINDRKSEVIAFVLNAGMNITFLLKYWLCSAAVPLDIWQNRESTEGYSKSIKITRSSEKDLSQQVEHMQLPKGRDQVSGGVIYIYIYIRNMFLKFRVIDGEYIVKISRGVV